MSKQTKRIVLTLAAGLALPLAAGSFTASAEENDGEKLTLTYEKPGVKLSNKNFEIEFGGMVKATASFDWGSPLHNLNSFSVYDIHGEEKGNGGRFGISGQQTELELGMRLFKNTANEIGIQMHGHFMGDHYAFELEEAFATFRGFKVGYAFGLFCDMETKPYTIDESGPNSFTHVHNGVIDYSHDFSNGIGVAIGAEMPMNSSTYGISTGEVSQRIPDIPAYVQYAWGEDSHVRLSAIMRTLTYRDLAKGKNRSNIGWGIKLSGTAEILPRLRAGWQAAYGEGVSSYFQDFTHNELDMTPAAHVGKMKLVKSWGAFANLTYSFTDRLFAGAGYSFLRNYADGSKNQYDWSDTYRNGQYVFANVFYDITGQVRWGLEYIYGQRKDMNRACFHDSRLQTMLQLTF